MMLRAPSLRVLLCACLLLVPVMASAASSIVTSGIGPRLGFSTDPDQFVFGGQATIGEIAPNITFDPNIEFGFGDAVTTIAGNFDLHYHFHLKNSPWTPYAGAGVTVINYNFDEPFPDSDHNTTEAGGSMLVGAGVPTASGNRFFSELKFGLGDVPSLKFMVGWNFKL